MFIFFTEYNLSSGVAFLHLDESTQQTHSTEKSTHLESIHKTFTEVWYFSNSVNVVIVLQIAEFCSIFSIQYKVMLE